jgi:hypothetical protein
MGFMDKKTCDHKDCSNECKHKVDVKSLEKSKDMKKKILEENKIVRKK